RVRSVDAQHFESQPSAVQRFSVVIPEVVPSVPGRRAAVRVQQGLFCALDGLPWAPVSAPIELSPGRAHSVRCADNVEGESSGEYAIAAANSGPILARVRAADPQWTTGGGSRRVAIRVVDATGAPVEGLEVSARADHGTVEGLARATEPGTHFATVRWQGAGVRIPFHVLVAGADVPTVELPEATPPTPGATQRALQSSARTSPGSGSSESPIARTDAAERVFRFAAGVDLGAIVGFGPLGPGVMAAVQARYRHSMSVLDIQIGLRVGYDRFACEGGTAVPGGYCTRPAASAQDPRITVESASFGLPLGLARRIGRVVVPYLTIQPQLVLGRSRVVTASVDDGPLRVGFGVIGSVGVEFALGAHAPFLEVGYRYAVLPDGRLGTLDLGGLALAAGYRAQW
ncbi:MAG: hypothetical protein WCJ30_18970, partial [Deltaproteobacteria bacterium]